MAIAIPILLAVTEVGAAAAAAIGISATTLAIGTGLVMGVTGINNKINKAASKVFGSQIVSAANIAGSLFLGATAAGLIGGAAEAAGGLAGAAGTVPEGVSAGLDLADAAMATGFNPAGAAGAAGPSVPGVSAANEMVGTLQNPGTIAPGSAAPSPPGALAQMKNGFDQAGKGLSTAWNKLGDKGQAAVLQIGGQALAGASAGKAAQEAEQARIANENRYRSGSGLSYWQRKPSYTTPPGG